MFDGQNGYPQYNGTPFASPNYNPQQPLPQSYPRSPLQYYPQQPQGPPFSPFRAPQAPPQPTTPAMGHDHRSMRAPPPLPPSLAIDPAFSADPRANPYSHYTTFVMDSREEIVPKGPSHDSFYPPHPSDMANRSSSRDSRVMPPFRRDISSIYGPPVVPERYASASRPPSDESHHVRSPSAAGPPAQDPRASAVFGDAPGRQIYAQHPAVIPVPPPVASSSHKAAKLHKPRHPPRQPDPRHSPAGSLYPQSASMSFSSSSSTSSFVHIHPGNSKSSVSLGSSGKSKSSLHVVNATADVGPTTPFTDFKAIPGSPSSSESSSEGPVTPPQLTPEKMSISSSHSSKHSKHSPSFKQEFPLPLGTPKVVDVVINSAEDSPPAYTVTPAAPEAARDPEDGAKADVGAVPSAGGASIPLSGIAEPQQQYNAQGPESQVNEPPPRTPRDASAPLVFPSASSTSSAQAPVEMKKTRSRKTSVAAPSKDLDKIDELDETDPLGFAWHHGGPYEAIAKASKSGRSKDGAGQKEGTGAKIFNSQGGVDVSMSFTDSRKPKLQPLNPGLTSFKVKPGQIFPPVLPPQSIAMPPPAMPTPMSPLAPMSPLKEQPFKNAHMIPAGRNDPVPPPFSPTPSQMERARNPERRMSMMSQMITEPVSFVPPPPSHPQPVPSSHSHSHSHSSSSSRSHTHSRSQGGSHSSHQSGTSSSSASSRNQSRPPPARSHDIHAAMQRPRPQPVQPAAPLAQYPPQVAAVRSHSTPAPRTATLPMQPQPVQPASTPFVLSAEPPPAPDIRLPPPSTRSAPSVNTHGQRAPQPRYIPKRLVMPTPLQPLQPLPQQQQQYQMPSVAGSNVSSGARGYGENRAARPAVRAQAQEIPMSAGRNLLKKPKEHRFADKELEREVKEIERWEKEREKEKERERERRRQLESQKMRQQEQAKAAAAPPRARAGPRPRSASLSQAVFTSHVVVPIEPSKSSGSGWGFGKALLFSSGDKSKEKAREKEKEKEREKEREREREKGKKLSKKR